MLIFSQLQFIFMCKITMNHFSCCLLCLACKVIFCPTGSCDNYPLQTWLYVFSKRNYNPAIIV